MDDYKTRGKIKSLKRNQNNQAEYEIEIDYDQKYRVEFEVGGKEIIYGVGEHIKFTKENHEVIIKNSFYLDEYLFKIAESALVNQRRVEIKYTDNNNNNNNNNNKKIISEIKVI